MVQYWLARIRIHWAWIALLGLGIVGGIACDPKPARPEVHRGGYRVLEADFHAHTTYSDGALSPFTLVRQAERHGLDVIGVTEHNTVYAAKLSRMYANYVMGADAPIVVVGEEITTARFHIIALGLSQTVGADQPPKNVIADVHAQNGVAIAAHPVAQYWSQLDPVRAEFDGAEVMHPIAYSSGGNWRWSDMIAFYEDTNRSSPRPLAAIGSSDFHWGSLLGICRTLVFVKEEAGGGVKPNEESVMEALRARRTVVIDHKGHLWGDADMIAALEREPYTPRGADYRYNGEGTSDRILRTLGFIGLIGVVVVGRGRAKQKKTTTTT